MAAGSGGPQHFATASLLAATQAHDCDDDELPGFSQDVLPAGAATEQQPDASRGSSVAARSPQASGGAEEAAGAAEEKSPLDLPGGLSAVSELQAKQSFDVEEKRAGLAALAADAALLKEELAVVTAALAQATAAEATADCGGGGGAGSIVDLRRREAALRTEVRSRDRVAALVHERAVRTPPPPPPTSTPPAVPVPAPVEVKTGTSPGGRRQSSVVVSPGAERQAQAAALEKHGRWDAAVREQREAEAAAAEEARVWRGRLGKLEVMRVKLMAAASIEEGGGRDGGGGGTAEIDGHIAAATDAFQRVTREAEAEGEKLCDAVAFYTLTPAEEAHLRAHHAHRALDDARRRGSSALLSPASAAVAFVNAAAAASGGCTPSPPPSAARSPSVTEANVLAYLEGENDLEKRMKEEQRRSMQEAVARSKLEVVRQRIGDGKEDDAGLEKEGVRLAALADDLRAGEDAEARAAIDARQRSVQRIQRHRSQVEEYAARNSGRVGSFYTATVVASSAAKVKKAAASAAADAKVAAEAEAAAVPAARAASEGRRAKRRQTKTKARTRQRTTQAAAAAPPPPPLSSSPQLPQRCAAAGASGAALPAREAFLLFQSAACKLRVRKQIDFANHDALERASAEMGRIEESVPDIRRMLYESKRSRGDDGEGGGGGGGGDDAAPAEAEEDEDEEENRVLLLEARSAYWSMRLQDALRMLGDAAKHERALRRRIVRQKTSLCSLTAAEERAASDGRRSKTLQQLEMQVSDVQRWEAPRLAAACEVLARLRDMRSSADGGAAAASSGGDATLSPEECRAVEELAAACGVRITHSDGGGGGGSAAAPSTRRRVSAAAPQRRRLQQQQVQRPSTPPSPAASASTAADSCAEDEKGGRAPPAPVPATSPAAQADEGAVLRQEVERMKRAARAMWVQEGGGGGGGGGDGSSSPTAEACGGLVWWGRGCWDADHNVPSSVRLVKLDRTALQAARAPCPSMPEAFDAAVRCYAEEATAAGAARRPLRRCGSSGGVGGGGTRPLPQFDKEALGQELRFLKWVVDGSAVAETVRRAQEAFLVQEGEGGALLPPVADADAVVATATAGRAKRPHHPLAVGQIVRVAYAGGTVAALLDRMLSGSLPHGSGGALAVLSADAEVVEVRGAVGCPAGCTGLAGGGRGGSCECEVLLAFGPSRRPASAAGEADPAAAGRRTLAMPMRCCRRCRPGSSKAPAAAPASVASAGDSAAAAAPPPLPPSSTRDADAPYLVQVTRAYRYELLRRLLPAAARNLCACARLRECAARLAVAAAGGGADGAGQPPTLPAVPPGAARDVLRWRRALRGGEEEEEEEEGAGCGGVSGVADEEETDAVLRRCLGTEEEAGACDDVTGGHEASPPSSSGVPYREALHGPAAVARMLGCYVLSDALLASALHAVRSFAHDAAARAARVRDAWVAAGGAAADDDVSESAAAEAAATTAAGSAFAADARRVCELLHAARAVAVVPPPLPEGSARRTELAARHLGGGAAGSLGALAGGGSGGAAATIAAAEGRLRRLCAATAEQPEEGAGGEGGAPSTSVAEAASYLSSVMAKHAAMFTSRHLRQARQEEGHVGRRRRRRPPHPPPRGAVTTAAVQEKPFPPLLDPYLDSLRSYPVRQPPAPVPPPLPVKRRQPRVAAATAEVVKVRPPAGGGGGSRAGVRKGPAEASSLVAGEVPNVKAAAVCLLLCVFAHTGSPTHSIVHVCLLDMHPSLLLCFCNTHTLSYCQAVSGIFKAYMRREQHRTHFAQGS